MAVVDVGCHNLSSCSNLTTKIDKGTIKQFVAYQIQEYYGMKIIVFPFPFMFLYVHKNTYTTLALKECLVCFLPNSYRFKMSYTGCLVIMFKNTFCKE